MNPFKVLFAALTVITMAIPGLVTAEEFPERPIELVVPFGAWGDHGRVCTLFCARAGQVPAQRAARGGGQ
ncbi:hypothetical protein BG841_06340 [Marinobacter sp. X15-166B]|nr:hypothetical protein BG841_06340 [Marinobacter sp. X15-166B]